MSFVTPRHLRTPLDLPIALFVVSALIGVWASYDPAASLRKFAMIVVAVALYYILVALRAAPQLLERCVWLFLFGCCALTLYFVTQHDYASHPGKFDFVTAIGLSLNRYGPQLGLHVFDPNITAGALEIGLPAAVALGASQKSKGKKQNAPFFSLGLLASLSICLCITFGLVMTSSRGAWLALGIVGCIAVLTVTAKEVLRRYALPIGVILILAGLIVLMRLGDTFMPTVENFLGAIPAGDTAVSRMELLRQGRGLVQDFYFTGSGLGVFPMVLSTYALLIDVPFLTHVHNLFLQVWLEQGLLGFVAFVWLLIEFYLWVWKRHNALSWLAWGGATAGMVMLLHGMVDVLLYSSRGLPLLLVPFGLAIASHQSTVDSHQIEGRDQSTVISRRSIIEVKRKARFAAHCLLPTALCLLLVSSFIPHPSSFTSLWFANIGSVEQTRVELGQYHWPDRLVQSIRRDSQLASNFQHAISNFQQALALDAGNVTANQRMAAIALAQGSYGDAQALLAQAYRRDPSNEVTNRLMGWKQR